LKTNKPGGVLLCLKVNLLDFIDSQKDFEVEGVFCKLVGQNFSAKMRFWGRGSSAHRSDLLNLLD